MSTGDSMVSQPAAAFVATGAIDTTSAEVVPRVTFTVRLTTFSPADTATRYWPGGASAITSGVRPKAIPLTATIAPDGSDPISSRPPTVAGAVASSTYCETVPPGATVMGRVLETAPLVIVTLCAPAARETRSGVTPRIVPSIATDEPSGTEWKSAVPVAATAFRGADAAGVAVHVCQASHPATTLAHTPPTATGSLRDDARGRTAAIGSRSGSKELNGSPSFGSCSVLDTGISASVDALRSGPAASGASGVSTSEAAACGTRGGVVSVETADDFTMPPERALFGVSRISQGSGDLRPPAESLSRSNSGNCSLSAVHGARIGGPGFVSAGAAPVGRP